MDPVHQALHPNARIGVSIGIGKAGAVPEPAPASWATMIGGLGLVGAARRRRRSALA